VAAHGYDDFTLNEDCFTEEPFDVPVVAAMPPPPPPPPMLPPGAAPVRFLFVVFCFDILFYMLLYIECLDFVM